MQASRDFKALGAFFCNLSRAGGERQEFPPGSADGS
jgi:hypothetical protein